MCFYNEICLETAANKRSKVSLLRHFALLLFLSDKTNNNISSFIFLPKSISQYLADVLVQIKYKYVQREHILCRMISEGKHTIH